MLAYCTSLKLSQGHLVYAKGAGAAVRHRIRESGIEIIGHALGLDCDPDLLLGQVRDLATELAGAVGVR